LSCLFFHGLILPLLNTDQSLVWQLLLVAWCLWCLVFAFFALLWTASGTSITTVQAAKKRWDISYISPCYFPIFFDFSSVVLRSEC
jgi:hypothetical protein